MKGINISRGTKSDKLSATVLGSDGLRDDYATEAVVFYDDDTPILYVEKDEMWTCLHVIKHVWYAQPLGAVLLDAISKLRGKDLPDFLDKLADLLGDYPNDLLTAGT